MVKVYFPPQTLVALTRFPKSVRYNIASFIGFFGTCDFTLTPSDKNQKLYGVGSRVIRKIEYDSGSYQIEHRGPRGVRHRVHLFKHKIGIIVSHAFLVTTKESIKNGKEKNYQILLALYRDDCKTAASDRELLSLFKLDPKSPSSPLFRLKNKSS